MYQKHIDPEEFFVAHSNGLTDDELAEHFEVSRSTIRRRRKQYDLDNNCPNNQRGQIAEHLTAKYFRNAGLQVVMPAQHNAPFDFLVNGWRVDVKLGRERVHRDGLSRSLEFRLPEQRHSNHARYIYRKDYQRDTDFLALVTLDEQETCLRDLYLLPSGLWRPLVTIRPDQPLCVFQKYRNALDLLSKQVVAGAA